MILPGPRNRWLSTYRLLARPFEAFPAWKAKYGDPFCIKAINGNVVITGRPDLIKQIFAADPSIYETFGIKALQPVLGPRSLLVMSGEPHRRERKLLMPPFHGARMRAYADIMRETARRHFEAAVDQGVIQAQSTTQNLTLEIILQAIFGIEDRAQAKAYMDAIVDLIDAVHPSFLFAPILQRDLGGLSPWAKFRRKLEQVDAMLQEQIERVRTRGPGEDVLSLMLQARYEDGAPMDDAHIRDELKTLVVAGHEMTAIALSWAIDCLHRDEQVLHELREEVDALGEDTPATELAKLPAVDRVCKETLRLYPILTESLRTLRRPLKLGDLEVPAGYSVSATIALTHRDPELYPEPEVFRPQRFAQRKFGPTEYLPYGGGHRRCLGAAFAEFELRIALATLLREFEVELVSPTSSRAVRRNLTMAPADGVPIRVRRRTRAAQAA